MLLCDTVIKHTGEADHWIIQWITHKFILKKLSEINYKEVYNIFVLVWVFWGCLKKNSANILKIKESTGREGCFLP